MVLSYSGYYTGLSSRISGFDSPQDRQVIVNAFIAQLVEQRIENPCVTGSNPVRGTKQILPA